MKRKRILFRILSPLIVLALGIGVFQLIVRNPPETTKRSNFSAPVMTVEGLVLERSDFQVKVKGYGNVRAQEPVVITAKIAGEILYLSPNLENGGFFLADEKLAEIDPQDAIKALQIAESRLRNASLTSLSTEQIEELRINVAQARDNLEDTTIHAPFAGRVMDRKVSPGEFVNRGTPDCRSLRRQFPRNSRFP